MNNPIYSILVSCILLFISVQCSGQKQIHFIHGMGGNGEGQEDDPSWKNLYEEFDTSCQGYNIGRIHANGASSTGVPEYAAAIDQYLDENQSTLNDILITHSAGGFTSRYLEANGSDAFGGYFTVGSAHHGAKMADSYMDGTVEDTGLDWCQTVDKALKDFQNLDNLFPVVVIGSALEITFNKTNNFQNAMMKIIAAGDEIFSSEGGCEDVVKLIFSNLSNFVGSSGVEETLLYDVGKIEGSKVIANLPNAGKPAYGITTSVPSPVHWRLIDHLLEGSNINLVDLSVQLEDNLLVSVQALEVFHDVSVGLYGNPFLWNYASRLRRATRKLQSSLYELRSTLMNSEGVWNNMIGAQEFTVVTTTETVDVPVIIECELDGGCPYGFNCIGGVCLPDNKDDICESNETVVTSTTVIAGPGLDSDGLIPVPDQELPGGLENGLLHVRGPSHFEQPNDPGVGVLIKARVALAYSEETDVFELPNCTF